MHHDTKIWPHFFGPVEKRIKTFEVRVNDRGYQSGDTITLHEWDPTEITKSHHDSDPSGILGDTLYREARGYTGKKAGPFLIGYVLPIDSERVVFSLLEMES
jgi:hypothetical protein